MSEPGTRQRGQGRVARLLGVAVAALFALVWASTSPTLSAWTRGVVVNTTDSTSTASLVFTHTTAAGGCTAGPRVTTTISCPGTLLGTDTIANTGTATSARLSEVPAITSCGPVDLDNRVTNNTNDLLPRYALTVGTAGPLTGSGAVTLDGASAYASSLTQRTLTTPSPLLSLADTGVGIWFRAPLTSTGGTLFSFDASPVNAVTSGSDDRTLSLNANGTLTYVVNTSGAKITTATGTSYLDGAWHFAYVRTTNSATTLYVGGPSTAATTVGTSSAATSGTTGYWHLGWGSTAYTGSRAYFGGDLSNFVVFSPNLLSAAAPSAPTAAQLASQTTFTTWATNATDHWLLNDTGTATYSGTHPVIGSTSPCSMVALTWSFTNPAGSAASGTSISAYVAAPQSVPAPGPGMTQTSTLTTGKTSTYNAYVTGLRLYTPFAITEQTTTGKWPLVFGWTSADAVVIAP